LLFDWKLIVSTRYLEDAIGKRFAVLAAILRMSTKYDVAHYRKLAIAKLHELCPLQLEQARQTKHDVIRDFQAVMGDLAGDLSLWAAPISLARECDVPELIPYCMLRCSVRSGDIALSEHLDNSLSSTWTTEDGRAYALPPEDLTMILIGGWRLADRCREIVAACFTDNGCVGLGDCRAQSAYSVQEKLLSVFKTYNPIDVCEQPDTSLFLDAAMCDDCSEAAIAVWNREMKNVWQHLPKYFGLPPWPN
jgi:hypothetical protein